MKIQELVEHYLDKQATTLAPSTLQSVSSHLRTKLDTVSGLDATLLDQTVLDDIVSELDGLSASAHNNARSSILKLISWAQTRNYIPLFVPEFPKHKVIPRERQRVDVQDFPRLLDACDHPRDRILVATLLHLVVRAAEARSIQWKHIDLDANRVEVTIHKTSDYHSMPIDLAYREELLAWQTWMLVHYGTINPDWFVIPPLDTAYNARRGVVDGLTDHQAINPTLPLLRLERPVQDVLKRIGFETNDREGAHTLRRSAARAFFDTLAADNSYDNAMRTTMTLLHHKSMQTTERYLGLSADRAKLDTVIHNNYMYGTKTSGKNLSLT